ncbi:MAG: hypothetical protein ACK55E_08545 [Cyanobacteriota bacterium]|jgi:hypothetical protein
MPQCSVIDFAMAMGDAHGDAAAFLVERRRLRAKTIHQWLEVL